MSLNRMRAFRTGGIEAVIFRVEDCGRSDNSYRKPVLYLNTCCILSAPVGAPSDGLFSVFSGYVRVRSPRSGRELVPTTYHFSTALHTYIAEGQTGALS